jgi:hypothetical protein
MQKIKIENPDQCPACMQYIKLAFSRKNPKLTHNEYEKLRVAYSDFFFNSHLEIKRQLFSSWGYAQTIKSQLDKYLELHDIVILPDIKASSLHEYLLYGAGLSRLTSLKRKIKLKEKLNKD